MANPDPLMQSPCGCACNLWSAWNCRYTRDVAKLCRAPAELRPELPPLAEIPRRPPGRRAAPR